MILRQLIGPALLSALLAGTAVSAQDGDLGGLRSRAEAGDAEAQYQLALRFDQGQGVPQNFAAARPWLLRAAEQGQAAAQNLLGLYHVRRLTGDRAETDQAQALHWLRQAAQSGVPDYLFNLARALDTPVAGAPDPAAAAALYQRAAEAGHVEAAVSLGVLYQEGIGVAQDYAAARALYERAGATGHPRALNNLGLLYVRGDGVPQDYAAAADLFEQAAQSGLAEAVRNLGVLYENGFGVAQDDARAAALYRQAAGLVRPDSAAALSYGFDPRLSRPAADDPGWRADTLRAARAGDPLAQYLAGGLALREGGARDAATWFARAARKGLRGAMTNLGLMYVKGEGVPQDYLLGYMWLSLAVSAGDPEARVAAELLLPRLTPGQLAEAQTRAEAKWAAIER